MNILVCVKGVPDTDQVFLSQDGQLTLHADAPLELRMNRYDEFAVEEAVRIRETYPDTLVTVITAGPEAARKVLRRAIGMGADAGVHLVCDYGLSGNGAVVSAMIAQTAASHSYDLIFCGVMSEDMMQFQTGPMLARRLGLPWATAVVRASMDMDQRMVSVAREQEGGRAALMEIRLPALLTVQSGINEPRYPALSKLLQADGSRILSMPAPPPPTEGAFGRVVSYAYPEKKRDGRVLEGTREEKARQLVDWLRERGGWR